MPDFQSMFRQFGQDVSSSILAPLETKLSVMKLRKEFEQAGSIQDKRAAEQEKRRLRGVATDSLRKKYGDEYADLYAAGESAGGLASLRRADAERIKALSEDKKARGDRYNENFDLTSKMTQQAQTMLSGALQKVADAKASGDKNAAAEAMNNYTTLYDGVSGMLKNQVYSIDKDLRAAYATNLATNAEKILTDLHPDKINMLDQALTGALKGKVDNDLLKEMEDAKAEYGIDIDLSGIPSSSDIQKYAWASISHGDLQQKEVVAIMNIKDPKTLEGIANDKEASMPARKLAGSLLKQQVAADAMDPSIRKKLQEMPYEDVDKLAAGTGEGIMANRIGSMAKKELKGRGKRASKIGEELFSYRPLIPISGVKKLIGKE